MIFLCQIDPNEYEICALNLNLLCLSESLEFCVASK
jgi:hypothetical protein